MASILFKVLSKEVDILLLEYYYGQGANLDLLVIWYNKEATNIRKKKQLRTFFAI